MPCSTPISPPDTVSHSFFRNWVSLGRRCPSRPRTAAWRVGWRGSTCRSFFSGVLKSIGAGGRVTPGRKWRCKPCLVRLRGRPTPPESGVAGQARLQQAVEVAGEVDRQPGGELALKPHVRVKIQAPILGEQEADEPVGTLPSPTPATPPDPIEPTGRGTPDAPDTVGAVRPTPTIRCGRPPARSRKWDGIATGNVNQ